MPSYRAFFDELEKIAVTPGWVVSKAKAAFNAGTRGSVKKNSFNDGLGRIADKLENRGASTLHPIKKFTHYRASDALHKHYLEAR
jgi:hypothetical protein